MSKTERSVELRARLPGPPTRRLATCRAAGHEMDRLSVWETQQERVTRLSSVESVRFADHSLERTRANFRTVRYFGSGGAALRFSMPRRRRASLGGTGRDAPFISSQIPPNCTP